MKKYVFLICFSFASTIFGKDFDLIKNSFSKNELAVKEDVLTYNQQKFQLIQESQVQDAEDDTQEQKRKSGIKAALLSAVIPGAGEYYAESYWKSAIFAAIEIVAWAGYLTYEDKGDSKDIQMRKLGDQEWSEQRYWTRVYLLAGTDWPGGVVEMDDETQTGVQLLSQESIDDNIDHLRDLEANGNFSRFTHTLPETKTQQYYEMIYKYLGQFGPGWKELEMEWGYYDGGANLDNLTPNVNRYRTLRNKSNDFYATAKAMTTVVLLNHLISAFDAAFSVRSYNKQLNYSLYAGQKRYAGEQVTTYGIALSW